MAASPDSENASIAGLVALLDLTSLEPSDDEAVALALAARALEPGAGLPPVAAVCVMPHLVATAATALAATPVRVATVAGNFPSGQASLAEKAAEAAAAVAAGAHEVDMVIDVARAVGGDLSGVELEVAAVRAASTGALLKVILETGLLPDEAAVRTAADHAVAGGADFLKTSTGKAAVGATLAAAHALAEVAEAGEAAAGRPIGVKIAGGIRSVEDARAYVATVAQVRGSGAVGPDRLRIGASSLLDVLVAAAG